MKSTITTLLVALALVGCHSTGDHDGSGSHDADAMAMTEAEMMEAMMAMAAPGPEHAYLAESVGMWNVSAKMWMDPSAPPENSSALSTIQPILGGIFFMERFQGDMGGMPFDGLLIIGYSNFQEQFMSVWMDSMNTTMSPMTGHRDENGVLHMSGTAIDAMSPEGRPMRLTVETQTADRTLFRMYHTMGGEESMIMEMVYTRP